MSSNEGAAEAGRGDEASDKEREIPVDIGAVGQVFDLIVSRRAAKQSSFVRLVGTALNVYLTADDDVPLYTTDAATAVQAIDFDISRVPACLIVVTNDGASLTLANDDKDIVLAWAGLLRSLKFHGTTSMNDYDVVHVIGRGFYGKVVLARHKVNGGLYAIKSVRKARLLRSHKVRTVFVERQALMRARHPFVVRLCEAFQDEWKVFLVLEYCSGGELFHHLRIRRVVPVEEARLYVAEIALAINFLHNLGVVYRDLKPENILLDAEGHLKLTDFGLAKQLMPGEDLTGTFCGTCEYLAPEVVAGEPYGFPIDWWGVGIVTYEMLYGAAPFRNANKARLMRLIRTEKPLFPPRADRESVSFIQMLLVKDPARRAGFEEIRTHTWMHGLDFERVLRREYTPAFRPPAPVGDLVPNVDLTFVLEDPADSLATPPPVSQSAFEGFSCVAERRDTRDLAEDLLAEDLAGLAPTSI